MKRFLFLFLSLSLFHTSVFGFENFDECGALEKIVKRDFDLYQFNEPDRTESERISFEFAPSTYDYKERVSYKR